MVSLTQIPLPFLFSVYVFLLMRITSWTIEEPFAFITIQFKPAVPRLQIPLFLFSYGVCCAKQGQLAESSEIKSVVGLHLPWSAAGMTLTSILPGPRCEQILFGGSVFIMQFNGFSWFLGRHLWKQRRPNKKLAGGAIRGSPNTWTKHAAANGDAAPARDVRAWDLADGTATINFASASCLLSPIDTSPYLRRTHIFPGRDTVVLHKGYQVEVCRPALVFDLPARCQTTSLNCNCQDGYLTEHKCESCMSCTRELRWRGSEQQKSAVL